MTDKSLIFMSPTLRTLATHCNFTLGAAITKEPAFFTDPTYRQLHADHFNLCVPANALKCGSICTQPNQYDFSRADAFVDFATQHNQAIRGHTLCWTHSYAPWMKKLTSLELEKVLRDYIITLVERYRGKIYAYDVVNEAIKDNGYPRNSIWQSVENFIPKCFQWAHEADPDAQLLYLDYRVHTIARWKAIAKMVRELKAANIPIHGVGMQLHHYVFRSLAISSIRLASAIRAMKDLGVAVHLCEVSIGIHHPANTWPAAIKFKLQAQAYRQVLKAALEAGAESFTVWGYADPYMIHIPPEYDPNNAPGLFDHNFQPKPVYQALCEELAQYAKQLTNQVA